MPRIIAYTYEAAMHCPDCTRARFARPPDLQRPESFPDRCGVPMDARDREGNLVHPVASTDEIERPAYCDTCRAEVDP